jgi:hypothetical protein
MRATRIIDTRPSKIFQGHFPNSRPTANCGNLGECILPAATVIT